VRRIYWSRGRLIKCYRAFIASPLVGAVKNIPKELGEARYSRSIEFIDPPEHIGTHGQPAIPRRQWRRKRQ
jgi:hypothetical protein